MSLQQGQKPKKKRQSNFVYNFTKITGGIPAIIWMRPKIIYENKKKRPRFTSALVCANHTSYLDPLLLLCVFPFRVVHFLATKELYSGRFKKAFFTGVGCIKVDKENFNTDSIHAVCDELKMGKMVAIFPEGRLNSEKKEQPLSFKSGAVLMAHLGGAPILPIYIVPNRKWYQRRIVVIGEPISVRDICKFPSIPEMERVAGMLYDKTLELKALYETGARLKNDNSM